MYIFVFRKGAGIQVTTSLATLISEQKHNTILSNTHEQGDDESLMHVAQVYNSILLSSSQLNVHTLVACNG